MKRFFSYIILSFFLLLLPAGQVGAALRHHIVKPIGQLLNKRTRLRNLQRVEHLLLGRVFLAIAQIICHCAAKQKGLLWNNADFAVQHILLLLTDVHTVHQHTAARHIIKTRD